MASHPASAGFQHAGSFHGTTIVRVQYQRLGHNTFRQTRFVNQLRGQLTGLNEPPRPQSCDCRDPGPGRGNKTDHGPVPAAR